MQLCKRPEILALLAALLLAACDRSGEANGFQDRLQVTSAELRNDPQQQLLQLGLQHHQSSELLEALHNGVVLTYAWRLELMDADGSPWQGRRWLDTGSLSLSYRSFTQWYTLSHLSTQQNKDYPDLESAQQAMQTVQLPVHIPDELMTEISPYRFRFRIYLDINQLPPPLRLPAHMSSTWRLDSGWHEWWPQPTQP
jgi:hypothetical protein